MVPGTWSGTFFSPTVVIVDLRRDLFSPGIKPLRFTFKTPQYSIAGGMLF